MPLANVIDVHCHIFNARDLPIPQFVRRVVAVDCAVAGAIAEPLMEILSLILDTGAPTAQEEIAEIDKIAGGVSPNQYIKTPEHQRQIVQSALERFLHPTDAVALARSPHDFKVPLDQRQALVDELFRRVSSKKMAPMGLLPLDLGSLAGELILGGEDVLQFFPWALTFTNYRFEILRQLSELSPDTKSEISFYVPAVIDYNNWLKGPDDVIPIQVTPMAEQAAVMAKISAMKNLSYAMHGYIAFDPWRQAVYQHNSGLRALDPTITDAITKQGFVGVKLYPPMGFQPIGNGDLTAADFPPDLATELGADCGKLLDDALFVLYDWCVEEDVPIMAHCGRSNYARKDFADRASPALWQRVLDYSDSRGTPYNRLRLNLGHVGGMTQFAKDQQGGDWMSAVLGMIGSENYPNLYADLAFDSLALERNDDEVAQDDKLMTYLKNTWLGTNVVNRLMYGSDWVMLGLEPGNDQYYTDFKIRFGAILGSDDLFNRLMKLNAANFLGLALQGGAKTKIRQRLDAFYSANALKPAILDAFL